MINELDTPVHVAYRLSSYSAAKHFGLKRMGLVAPGKQADIILLNDLRSVDIKEVFIKGELVSELSLQENLKAKLDDSNPPMQNTMKRADIKLEELSYSLTDGNYNVIGIVKDEIITEHLKLDYNNGVFSKEDVAYIAVFERYGQGQKPSLGLVHGSGIRSGAIASSVAHDSHNIIVIGKSEDEMVLAANQLLSVGGGFCVIKDKKVDSCLPLPIAGLLSLADAKEINDGIIALKKSCIDIGVHLNEPFIQMAFLALPVIPTLKITDKGLVDVTKFEFINLKN